MQEIDPKISHLLIPMQDRIEILLQARSQWKSDDERKSRKLWDRFDVIEADYFSLKTYIEQTVSPIQTCLLEQVHLQIAADE